MKFSLYAFTTFMATAVVAMPHGSYTTFKPTLYIRAPDPGCIKRSGCGYVYIKRDTENVDHTAEVFLKVREPGCIKRSCGYKYIKRSDIE